MTVSKASLNITDPNMRSDNQITDILEIDNAIANAVGGDFSRDHIDEDTSSLITVGTTPPASPTTYEAWRDTTSSTVPIDKFWSGSAWRPMTTYVQDTAPTDTNPNARWFDTNLNLNRVYRELHGITGWHPVERGYKLMENVSGATVLAARAVIHGSSTTDTDFQVTNFVKDQRIIGVLIEETANGANGIVQLLGCLDPVDIYLVGSTHGAVAAGDGICLYGDPTGATTPDGGSGRNIGAFPGNPFTTITSHHNRGVPLGCFAVALETVTTDGVGKCRLLPQVGGGCTVMMDRTAVIATVSQNGSGTSSWTEVDLNTYLKDAGHSPIFSGEVEFKVTMTAGNPGTGQIEISPNQVDVQHELFTQNGGTNGTSGYTAVRTVMTTEDSTSATPNGLGDKFSVRSDVDTASGLLATNIRCVGYTY